MIGGSNILKETASVVVILGSKGGVLGSSGGVINFASASKVPRYSLRLKISELNLILPLVSYIILSSSLRVIFDPLGGV